MAVRGQERAPPLFRTSNDDIALLIQIILSDPNQPQPQDLIDSNTVRALSILLPLDDLIALTTCGTAFPAMPSVRITNLTPFAVNVSLKQLTGLSRPLSRALLE